MEGGVRLGLPPKAFSTSLPITASPSVRNHRPAGFGGCLLGKKSWHSTILESGCWHLAILESGYMAEGLGK